ncbi:MAG: epoxyqueuosine reductase QueH [Nitrospiraceae bacterium]|nr:epoxyqueuosine reductase QueH [Nitrospiraceae bacterium]
MKLLLHICCVNCALYPVRKLNEKGVSIKGLWYNPNIHPAQEYLKRLEAVRQLEALWRLDITYTDHYGLKEFLEETRSNTEPGARCVHCYRMRLREAASAAKKMKADAFGTTLMYSPYQKFDIIIAEAAEAERLFHVPFYFEDWRGGFKEGESLSRELGVYRQKYCGCLFSEMERFIKIKKAKNKTGNEP